MKKRIINNRRRNIKENNNRKKLGAIISIIVSVVAISVIIFIVIPKGPSEINVESYAAIGNPGSYAVKSGNNIFFYADYNGTLGIYKLSSLNHSVSLLDKTVKVGSIAANQNALFYTSLVTRKKCYALNTVNLKNRKTDFLLLNNKMFEYPADCINIYHNMLFFNGLYYVDINNVHGKLYSIENGISSKSIFPYYDKSCYLLKTQFLNTGTIIGINDNGDNKVGNFLFSIIDNKTKAPVFLQIDESGFPLGIQGGKYYLCLLDNSISEPVQYNICCINGQKVTNTIQLPTLANDDTYYNYSYFNRVGDDIILLGQEFKGGSSQTNVERSHVTDAAVSFNTVTNKVVTLLQTVKGQRILYCDLKKAIVYDKGEIISINLMTKKESYLYKIPDGVKKIISEPCGNYIFLYSCDIQNFYNYEKTLDWTPNLRFLDYIKIN